MLDVVKAELDRLKGKVSYHVPLNARADRQSWIIDGFPRTLHQGELLDQVLEAEVGHSSPRSTDMQDRPLNMIVHLNVPDSVIMARIAGKHSTLQYNPFVHTTSSMGSFTLGQGL
jgi:adenylate kinase